jgi:membrane fusion protein (multidrug efflux system)
VAESKQGDAGVGEIRATIERKTIRAPFAGILGIRQVNLGQYMNGGDPVVPLQSLDPILVNFAVPQQDMRQMKVGAEVRVVADGALAVTGKVTAIDSIVDPATRNVKVQGEFANPDGKLRPGMFVEAYVVLGTDTSVVALPATAINYAPYGDSVFIVEELKDPKGQTYRGVRQQFVKLGSSRGDQVAVLSGVRAGEEVVTSGVFKLRNGAAVHVDNSVQPPNEAAPQPEES